MGNGKRIASGPRPSPSQDAEEVAGKDALDVGLAPPAGAEMVGQLEDVGDGLDLAGCLLVAEGSVEVGADANVPCGAGDLGDVVGVFGDVPEAGSGGFRGALAADPAGDDHPRVEGEADDGVALGEEAEVFVGELALMRDEGAAEVVAGPDGAVEEIEGFHEAFVAEVGDVEEDAEALHLAEEVASAGVEAAGGGGALRIDAGTVMGGANGSEAVVP